MEPLDERNSFPTEVTARSVKEILKPEIDVMERQYGNGKENEQSDRCGFAGSGL